MSPFTPNSDHRFAGRAGQTGATLIVGLVLLLVLTVLGVSGMNTATMEVTMAGNAQFQQDAFQMAEDAIDIVLATELYRPSVDLRLNFMGGGAPADRTAETRYRWMTLAPGNSGGVGSGTLNAYHFDTTSVGRGPRNGSSVHVQSFYIVGRSE